MLAIENLATAYGVYRPDDLALLQGIFDEVCIELKPMGQAEAQAIARKLLLLAKGGVRDRDLLKLTVSRRPRPATPHGSQAELPPKQLQ
jgi:hypothetical protein